MAAPKGDNSRHGSGPDEVIFHTYPKLVFAWPVILAGFILFIPASIWPDAEGFMSILGWIYVGTIATVFMTMGIDLDRNLSVFWLVVVAAILLLTALLDANKIELLAPIARFFGWTEVSFDKGLALAISLMLTPPYLLMLFWSRLNHKWRMTHNEFEHYAWGRSDDSLARGAKRVRSTYPDWLEFMLMGAGTLIVYSATGRQELRRIPHVPMLFRVRKKINHLLESQSVTIGRHDEALMDEISAEEDDAGTDRADELAGRHQAGGLGSENDPL